MKFDKELDVRGLKCPLHVLRVRKAITQLASGQVLKIRAQDAEAVKDFRRFSKQTRNPLVDLKASRQEFVLFIRKA